MAVQCYMKLQIHYNAEADGYVEYHKTRNVGSRIFFI